VPKLNKFKIEVETGEVGTEGPVRFCINNHTLPLDNPQGGVGPGETFTGEFEVRSFAHSMTLVGPEKGEWNIKKIKVDFDCENVEPYSALMGEVALDSTTEVNIWRDPPLPVWDV